MDKQITGLAGEYFVAAELLKRGPNCFTLHTEKIRSEDFYVFVYLNGEEEQPNYFIVKGEELLSDKTHYYGASLGRSDLRETVNHGALQEHRNQWSKLNK
ncbi:MAG: hypothetical protein JNM22_13130 [Saprospiraceae bacterium]|nr:hypothetical protein [Saprospiraceae bacterium]